MPAKKRPTTPKIKGCYECSQRRISCDRAEPHCKKCTIKGLQRSGLGIRYRFNHGMSSRGKFIGKSINDILARPQSFSLPKDPDGKGFDEQCHDLAKVAKSTSCHPSLACEDMTGLSNQVVKSNAFNSDLEGQEAHQFFSLHTYEVSLESMGDPTRGHLDLVPGWKRCLLNYFSENIAPAMVAIDDKFNGYRALLLPIAELDESVMNAVLSASAYHISHKSAKYSCLAQSFYTNAIRGLIVRMDKYIADANSIQDNFNLLTILVLLVTAMITGEADFPLLFNLLKIGLRDIGGESSLGSSPLDRFILRQTRKLQLYAEPLLDEEEGARIVTTKLQEGLDCLHYCAEIHPEHSSAMLYISDLIQQACNIYLGRALDTLTPSTSITLVDNFITKYKAFPEGDPGSHVLVWALFVVAAESSTPEQKSFFAKEFQDFYLWGGFANNIKAVSLLEKLWAATSSQRWTSLLPQGQVFIM